MRAIACGHVCTLPLLRIHLGALAIRHGCSMELLRQGTGKRSDGKVVEKQRPEGPIVSDGRMTDSNPVTRLRSVLVN